MNEWKKEEIFIPKCQDQYQGGSDGGEEKEGVAAIEFVNIYRENDNAKLIKRKIDSTWKHRRKKLHQRIFSHTSRIIKNVPNKLW